MDSLVKVKCITCEGKYYVNGLDTNVTIPKDIKPGEAFPNACPLCEEGRYAVLADEE